MFGASLHLVVLRLQLQVLPVQLLRLGAELVHHLELQLPLSLLLVQRRGVGLHQVAPEDRIEAVTQEALVADRLQLPEVAAQILLELEVLLPLRVFEPSDLLGLAHDSRLDLLLSLFCFFSLPSLQSLVEMSSFVSVDTYQFVHVFDVLVELSLRLLLLDGLLLQFVQEILIPLSFGLDVLAIHWFVLDAIFGLGLLRDVTLPI